MFSKILTERFMNGYSYQSRQLKMMLEKSDAVIIGAGAGLSTSSGFTYSGKRFDEYFSDFAQKYGIKDMYSGGFYPFESLEEYWAYWSRYVYINRYTDIPKPVYKNLFEIVKDKDYFVITTNVDHCFQKADFDKHRLFYTQGDYGLFQCSKPCCNETYDNKEIILEMVKKQKNMKIPAELIPYCLNCGRPLSMNLRADSTFVEDEGWHKAAKRYDDFIMRHKEMKVLFLELGVGYNTPIIIKYPFWKYTYENYNARYVCVNTDDMPIPEEIRNRALCIKADIGDILEKVI